MNLPILPLSKAKLALFSPLREKKHRYKSRMFIVEGEKMVRESLASGFALAAVVVEASREENVTMALLERLLQAKVPVFSADSKAFAQLNSLESPEGVLAVVCFPENSPFCQEPIELEAAAVARGGLLLDSVQDPGNLGAILRIADWFGLGQVICGKGTADVLNPKTLRSSMGAIFRVQISYTEDLPAFVQAHALSPFLADMNGLSIAEVGLTSTDWVVLGNEANGVSETLRGLPSVRKITIPRLGGAESLNVAVAAGIVAWEMRR